jgi:hypothetical protein
MKRFLVFILILSIIFPAYCFATPDTATINKEQAIAITYDELIEAIMVTLEDSSIEQEEIELIQQMVEDVFSIYPFPYPPPLEAFCLPSLFWTAIYACLAPYIFNLDNPVVTSIFRFQFIRLILATALSCSALLQ